MFTFSTVVYFYWSPKWLVSLWLNIIWYKKACILFAIIFLDQSIFRKRDRKHRQGYSYRLLNLCLSFVALMIILFVVISLRAPPTPWGDVSQALIYHQVGNGKLSVVQNEEEKVRNFVKKVDRCSCFFTYC